MKNRLRAGNRKVAIIGAGYVGSSIAYALAIRDIAREIVLIDKDMAKAKGEVRDIRHGVALIGTAELYAGEYSDCGDCDMIIITAGRNRREGESRLDLTNDNVAIMREVVASLKPYYTRGVVLIISNPVDILTYKVDQWMGLPDGMVFGSGCLLDTSRLLQLIADYVEINPSAVSGYLVGEHGDGQVPVWSRMAIGGVPIAEYCQEMGLEWNETIMRQLAERTKSMGTEIIQAKGRTHYGIATCVCAIADAVLNMRPTILPVSSRLKGEHGVDDVALSVPSVVGPSGVQQRIREKWSEEEFRGFFDAVRSVRKILAGLE